MESIAAGIFTATWLGILTSISPCPLASNIAAVSFIGKRVGSTRSVLLSGLFYTIGRMAAYQIIAIIVVTSLMSIPQTASFLQKYINLILGPLLIVVGLFLSGIIGFGVGRGIGVSQKLQDKALSKGLFGAAMLGFIFALSFCPVSAGLFFGSLIPLSIKNSSPFLLPLIFGIGTALPVIGFAFVIAFAVNSVGKIFDKLTKYERVARKITGFIILAIGVYLTLKNLPPFFFDVDIIP